MTYCQKCYMGERMRFQAAMTHGLFSGESYTFSMHGPEQEITWLVDIALGYIRSGLVPIMELDLTALAEWIRVYADIDEPHLDHIPLDRLNVPGIMLLLSTALKVGDPLETFPVLMDGTHRAMRAIRDGRRFFVYMLNEAQQLDCRIRMTLEGREIVQPAPQGVGWPDPRDAKILANPGKIMVTR